jgi:hypothetical protein
MNTAQVLEPTCWRVVVSVTVPDTDDPSNSVPCGKTILISLPAVTDNPPVADVANVTLYAVSAPTAEVVSLTIDAPV